jgi:hypothetical protein
VRAVAGFSANVAAAGLGNSLAAARAEAAGNPNVPSAQDVTYARGALVAASVAPGIAPLIGARVGLEHHLEGGLAYTGRGARADARYGFNFSRGGSLSVGLVGSAAFYGHQDTTTLPNVDLGQLHGWGVDVPLVLGWESEAGLYMAWVGVRGGWEGVDISEVRSEPKDVTIGVPPIGLSAARLWAGGLIGVATGFRHVHVAMELDVAYQHVSGTYNATGVSVDGLTLTPGSALWWDF